MFEKDYLMRLFTDFMNALNEILNSINKKDIDGAKEQINYNYQILGNDSTYFSKTNINDIISYFKKKEGDYLKRIQMLAELMYCDYLVQNDKEVKRTILKKSIQLLEFYSQNTKEYSFDIINKLNNLKNEFSAFNY